MNGKKKNRQEELPAGTRGREAELRGYLYALIEQELEKGDAADEGLIRECSEYDAYLTGADTPLSEEEYQAAMVKIKSLAAHGGIL